MTTKTLDNTLITLRIVCIVIFIIIISIIVLNLIFPTFETALVSYSIIILLLFVCIIGLLCYLYFDKEKSKRDNEESNHRQTEQIEMFRKRVAELEKLEEYLKGRCKYLDKKFHRETIKTDILTRLIENTFNQVLDNSNYGK